jgi:hypothetical protein
MATEITNNGASLKIVVDAAAPRYIMKNQIKEIEVVRDTIIKIDIGQGALYNVFIDQAVVDSPASTSVDDLRDQIMGMLQTTAAVGLATQELQTAEINQLKTLQASVSGLNDKVTSLDNKLFYEPALIDESNANVVYEGYAAPGTKTSDPLWAVLMVTNKKGVLSYQWANGNKGFTNVWDNRKTLAFS